MITRRSLIELGAAAAMSALLPSATAHAQRFALPAPMRPGEFRFTPEASPTGPVVIIVSLLEQLVHVYRGGIEIAVSTCSTGKPGHRTPTGVFTILEKERQHVSSIYKGAQMPNMERLTWGGIALHAGNLPGYPASHGCIRLPLRFSALLFDVTHSGSVVIIADERTQPNDIVHPGLLLSDVAEAEARALSSKVATRAARDPWAATIAYPLTAIVISRADRRAYVTRDGTLDAAYPVVFSDPGRPIGTHTYSLVGPAADGGGLTWLSFGLGKAPTEAHIVNWQGDAAMRRVQFSDPARARRVAETFHAGTTLLLTDAPAPPASRNTGKGFSVISSEVPG